MATMSKCWIFTSHCIATKNDKKDISPSMLQGWGAYYTMEKMLFFPVWDQLWTYSCVSCFCHLGALFQCIALFPASLFRKLCNFFSGRALSVRCRKPTPFVEQPVTSLGFYKQSEWVDNFLYTLQPLTLQQWNLPHFQITLFHNQLDHTFHVYTAVIVYSTSCVQT